MSDTFADALRRLMESISPRERRVVELRYGLDNGYHQESERSAGRTKVRKPESGAIRSLEEVGQEFDVTRERIRQIEAKAFRQLRHPSRRRIVVAGIESELKKERSESLTFPDRTLKAALARHPEEYPYPERWLAFLGKVYGDVSVLRPTESLLKQPRTWLSHDLQQSGGSIAARTFADSLVTRGIEAKDVNRIMAGLYETTSNYAWVDGFVVVPRYIEIARFVLRQAGTELHWKEIYEKAMEVGFEREINPSTMYNAILANDDIFVYRRQGTYGLAEWGMTRRPWQKDTIANWFRRTGRNAQAEEIVEELKGTEDEIGHSSVAWYLVDNPLFFEDIDGDFGLREWLPPLSEQRIDTPRTLRESKRSRERRGPEAST